MVRGRDEAGRRLGIDIDSKNHLNLLLCWFNARRSGATVEVYETNKGYHIRINKRYPVNRRNAIRAMLRDDPARIRLDETRYHAEYFEGADVLFDHERDFTVDPLSPPWWEGPR